MEDFIVVALKKQKIFKKLALSMDHQNQLKNFLLEQEDASLSLQIIKSGDKPRNENYNFTLNNKELFVAWGKASPRLAKIFPN